MTISKSNPIKPYLSGERYSASKVVVMHSERPSLLLVNRQIGDTFGYEAAGGRVNIDFTRKQTETFEECAVREAQEELGLRVSIKDYLGSYAFFWESMPNTCTHCVVFLAEPLSDLEKIQSIGDTDGHLVRSEWVEVARILKGDLRIRDNHAGLIPLLQKAALSFSR